LIDIVTKMTATFNICSALAQLVPCPANKNFIVKKGFQVFLTNETEWNFLELMR